jgi:ATP-binding cassette, subfamily B, bacterial
VTAWDELAWSEDALDEAIVALARVCGLCPRAIAIPRVPADLGERDARGRDRWFEAAAHYIGIEVEPTECAYGELDAVLAGLAPALVCVPSAGGRRYLAVLSSKRGGLRVITPSLARRRVAVGELRETLTLDMEQGPSERVDRWLSVAHVDPRRLARARRELLTHFLAERRVGGMWLLRADPGASFWRELRRKGVFGKAASFAAASLAQVVVGVVGWALIGSSSLDGVVERSWLLTWILVSLSAIPLQLASASLGGRIAADIAAVLKQRLLAGALRLDPEVIRTQGSGRLLGMVSESTAIEAAGLGGALGAAVAVVQLVSAVVVLSFGVGGVLHVVTLLFWCVVVGLLAARAHRRRLAWTRERLGLTSSFVENVVGNRTRVVQEPPHQWHRLEDDMLTRYLTSSRAMDAASTQLAALPARGWLVLGSLALLPAMLAGHAEPVPLAISVGGILQAQAAFAALMVSATSLIGAHVAWGSIGRLFRGAGAMPTAGVPNLVAGAPRTSVGGESMVVEAHALSFRYRPAGDAVLRGCSLALRRGERVLLEGRSGGGKSTFAALLAGLRCPETGYILMGGLDRSTLGDSGWRARVASAPQFHENHVLSATLGFNLLMGRSWPPSDEDRREATSICRELGLGSMLDRMPSGLDQVVGETGWQLSHGERSRVFLARALLQRAELIVLDETFGALDPLTVRGCLDTVLRRSPALIVIAHP